MKKVLLFFLCFYLFTFTLIAKPAISYKSAKYQIEISKLYNLQDTKPSSEVLNLANKIWLDYPLSSDALLVIGNVYFYKKYYDLALSYYLKIKFFNQNFLLAENELELYEKISSCYLMKREFLKAKKYINRILSKTTVKDQYGNDLEEPQPRADMISQKYYYEAQFFLGNIDLWNNSFSSAQRRFNLCLKKNYYNKLIYLLLCNYLIFYDEDQISNKKKQEMLKYYYKKFNQSGEDRNYFLYKDNKMIEQVNKYFRVLKEG